MNYATLRWAGIVFPTILVALFETIRHKYLERFLPGMVGNLVTGLVVLAITFFFYTRLFRAVERVNQELVAERERSALLQERDRIAREMHDGLSQSLFFLNIKLKSAERSIVRARYEDAQREVADARATVGTLYTRVRQTIYDLKNTGSDDWTLDGAIETTLNELQTQRNIRTHLEVRIKNDNVRSSVEAFHLLQIARESLYNASRHADATYVRVVIDIAEDGTALVEVSDDGRGFDVAQAAQEGRFGLTMMRERAALVGADLQVSSAPGRGTTVRVVAKLGTGSRKEAPSRGTD